MTPVTATALPRPAVAHVRSGAQLVLLPGLVVVGATCFNAALAVANAHVTTLTSAPVIAAEVLFVGAAHVLALREYRREMTPWYVLLGVFLTFACVRAFYSHNIDVKYLRDVLIIPTFVVLGMTFDSRRLAPMFVAIQLVMLVFLVLEAANLDAFSNLFAVKDYYINTRDYKLDDFWNGDSDLFVSASRPDGSFLSLVNLHRLSSIFLEPVSLGNYCMVVVAFLCACWSTLGRGVRWFLVVSTALAMIGCDGRLAMASIVPMVILAVIAPRLPRPIALLYAPGVLLLGFLLVDIGHFQPGGDDLPGRLAHTIDLLRKYGVPEFLGLSDEWMAKAVDSGIAYLITTQSIFIVLAMWVMIALSSPAKTRSSIRIVHVAMVYVALTMMVSYAFLTIKTAALLWFTFGSLQTRLAAVRRPEHPARTEGLPGAAIGAGARPALAARFSPQTAEPRSSHG